MEVLPCISDSLVYDDLLSLIRQHFPEAYDLWPRTYDEWYDLHKRELFEQRRLGRKAREIQVYPGEFVEFCRAHKHKGTPQDLGLWARHDAAAQDKILREFQAQADYDTFSESVD